LKTILRLNGNYEALEAGLTVDAIIDMSGGVREEFNLTNLDESIKKSLWTILFQAYRKQSIMGCSINADPNVREARQSNGLVRGHAYTITKLAIVNSRGREARLIRIRNPWGI
jgi:calpain